MKFTVMPNLTVGKLLRVFFGFNEDLSNLQLLLESKRFLEESALLLWIRNRIPDLGDGKKI
jgi:hypothetical protein